MEIRIPFNRTHVRLLLGILWSIFRNKEGVFSIECDDAKINGEENAVLFSQEDVRRIEVKLANNGLLAEQVQQMSALLEVALDAIPEESPAAREVREGLRGLEKPRVLH